MRCGWPKSGDLGVSELKRLRMLEDENARFKRIVADLTLLRPSVCCQKSEVRDQSALRQRIREIAIDRPRFGYFRVLVMLRREDWEVGKKRVYRLYRLEGLQLRM